MFHNNDFVNLTTIAGVIWKGNYEEFFVKDNEVFLVVDTEKFHAIIVGIIKFVETRFNDLTGDFDVWGAIDAGDNDLYRVKLVERFNGISDQIGTENKNDQSRLFSNLDSAKDYIEMLCFIKDVKYETLIAGVKKEAKKRGL